MRRFIARWLFFGLCCLGLIYLKRNPKRQIRKTEFADVQECDIKDLKCFGLGSSLKEMREASQDKDKLWSSRQKLVVDAFKHAWKGYSENAFGFDEYYPSEKRGENFVKKGFGFTIVDSLDTMILMGLEEEYDKALNWVENNLNFNQDESLNVFETTIRVFGGLLSSYFLTGSKNEVLFEKAKDLGERLSHGFDTKTGIPTPTINIGTGKHSYESLASTAEAATLQLENKFLSYLTGNSRYWGLSQHVNEIIDDLPKLDGLVPIFLSISSGTFSGSEIRLGSRGDSYYEYLLKQWLQTNKNQPEFRRQYDQAVSGIKKWLVGYTYPRNLTYIGEIDLNNPTELSPKMDHLVCFVAGNLALGATEGASLDLLADSLTPELSKLDKEDIQLAEEVAEACWYTYKMNPTGLAAEITVFNDNINKTKDAFIKPADTHNLLRPETIESFFILWRITKNEKYREWGWEMFQSFEKYTRVDSGYVSLSDVTVIPPIIKGKMETFFLAETLKYFYLLFSNENFLPLDKIVFNTEAHPFPRFTPSIELLNFQFSEIKEEDSPLLFKNMKPTLVELEQEENVTPPSLVEDDIVLDELELNSDVDIPESSTKESDAISNSTTSDISSETKDNDTEELP